MHHHKERHAASAAHVDLAEKYRSISEVVGFEVLSLTDINADTEFDPNIVYEEHYQMVFMMMELEIDPGHTVAEVAEMMNRTPTWVAGVMNSEVYKKMKDGGWKTMDRCNNHNIADILEAKEELGKHKSHIVECKLTASAKGAAHRIGSSFKGRAFNVDGVI